MISKDVKAVFMFVMFCLCVSVGFHGGYHGTIWLFYGYLGNGHPPAVFYPDYSKSARLAKKRETEEYPEILPEIK